MYIDVERCETHNAVARNCTQNKSQPMNVIVTDFATNITKSSGNTINVRYEGGTQTTVVTLTHDVIIYMVYKYQILEGILSN